MKLNPDCIRDILLVIEEKIIPDEDGDTEPITAEELCDSVVLRKYQRGEVLYTVKSLFREGMVEEGPSYVSDSFPRIADLTAEGRRFLSVAKSNSVWVKVKKIAAENGVTLATELLKIGLGLLTKT